MFVFLDESFRSHDRTGNDFGVLAGVIVTEERIPRLQSDVYYARKPYHDMRVLKPDDELKGSELLGKATFRKRRELGFSEQWNLVDDLLGLSVTRGIKVAGVVCFRDGLRDFRHTDDLRLEAPFRYVFERVQWMMRDRPRREFAKIVFDNRDFRANEMNARAITNFLVRSSAREDFDRILPIPLFGVSQAHNYAMQLADVVATVIAVRYQGRFEIDALWRHIRKMAELPGAPGSGIKVMRTKKETDPAAFRPMAE